MMLNCKQASELISQSVDETLPLRKRLALRVHLFICDGCSNFTSQIDFLRKVANRHDKCPQCQNLHLSQEAKQRISRALKNAQAKKDNMD